MAPYPHRLDILRLCPAYITHRNGIVTKLIVQEAVIAAGLHERRVGKPGAGFVCYPASFCQAGTDWREG